MSKNNFEHAQFAITLLLPSTQIIFDIFMLRFLDHVKEKCANNLESGDKTYRTILVVLTWISMASSILILYFLLSGAIVM